MDQILNIAGVIYLVVMPYTFLIDWTAIALNAFNSEIIIVLHGVVDLVWSAGAPGHRAAAAAGD